MNRPPTRRSRLENALVMWRDVRLLAGAAAIAFFIVFLLDRDTAAASLTGLAAALVGTVLAHTRLTDRLEDYHRLRNEDYRWLLTHRL